MQGKIDNDLGNYKISRDVIASIAGSAAVECVGIISMADVNITRGIVRMAKNDTLGKGIDVVTKPDGSLELTAHIIVVYGVNISAVTTNLIESVAYRVESQTGLRVSRINVRVEGVRRID